MASIVHENRKKRNSWAETKQPELWVSYSELPEEEKETDRVQIRQAIAKIKSGK